MQTPIKIKTFLPLAQVLKIENELAKSNAKTNNQLKSPIIHEPIKENLQGPSSFHKKMLSIQSAKGSKIKIKKSFE